MKKILALMLAFLFVFAFISCNNSDDNSPKISKNKDGTVTITIQDDNLGFIESNAGKVGTDAGKNSSNGKYFESFPQLKDGVPGGANIKYCVNTDTAGNYILTVHYAFGGTPTNLRDAYVFINGSKYTNPENADGTLRFEYTIKNWSVWADASITIPLAVGDNFISIEAAEGVKRNITVNGETQEGTVVSLPNIDYVSIQSTATDVKLAAGSSNAKRYWSVLAKTENAAYGSVSAVIDITGGTKYEEGTNVTLTATPQSGYRFDCWYGTKTSSSAVLTFELFADANITARFVPQDAEIPAGLSGYATITDDSGTPYTITGGLGGETLTIASLSDLQTVKSKISSNDPYIISVKARITTDDNKSTYFDVGSNKTIIGEAGKDYGFKNINVKITGSNVIVKNLHFGDVIALDYFAGSGNDALSIKGGEHVWIDHCEFSSHLTPHDNDGNELEYEAKYQVDLEGENTTVEEKFKKDFYDGLLDITNGSRFVSISNSYFHDHWKACLCGGSNDSASSQPVESVERITFYNNYFENIHSRMPLFRFGKAHIFSSYYKGLAGGSTSTGIEVRAQSEVYVDHCFFEDIRSDRTVGCWNSSSGLGPGSYTTSGNTGMSNEKNNNYQPPYTWNAASASDSKANLPSTAGIEK